ncbi:carboxylesterase family protein [Salinisphaera sp.]|uniref:carboxylesterase family protein n=1 Tax=Salinisphaera sp. TaxID=1914330 RepID=UPI003C7A76FE
MYRPMPTSSPILTRRRFSYRRLPRFEYGPTHSSEIQYVLDFTSSATLYKRPSFTPAQQQLAQAMTGYWTRFARTGNPNARQGMRRSGPRTAVAHAICHSCHPHRTPFPPGNSPTSMNADSGTNSRTAFQVRPHVEASVPAGAE